MKDEVYTENMNNKMRIEAYLNSNPVLRGETLIDPWGRKYEMNNNPYLEIEFYNFPRGRYTIQIRTPFFSEKRVTIHTPFSHEYFTDERFQNPSISATKIKISGKKIVEECVIPHRVNKLTGTVRTFNGKPLRAYVWATGSQLGKPSMITQADEHGKYVLYYPTGRKLRAFVGDTNYAKSTLECWITANNLKENVVIHPHIGNFELYELNAWFFDGMWNMFFVPATVHSKFPPNLSKKDMSVRINGMHGKIKRFTNHRVYFKGKYRGVFYPAYIMTVVTDKPIKEIQSPVIIKVQIRSPKKGRGEAWFIY
ncbi:hypothetical protein AMJ52_08430 [candidate division TA06 bacterium DG_78]|uniref:Uncharacterized protein n=1 Tax=candidate division TA06 bacterium DG_78 TaxID=1703772 RepID=A0A0S7YAE9_UNCT6|nr:MAG: hypothetical protein AMJ52_08430 [candidate division TA06 bacterium DG_78]